MLGENFLSEHPLIEYEISSCLQKKNVHKRERKYAINISLSPVLSLPLKERDRRRIRGDDGASAYPVDAGRSSRL